MTDEEKAIKNLCLKCNSYDFCMKGNKLHCAETVAYIKGLAEGRKERLRSEAKEIIKDLLYCTDGIVEVSIPEENRFLSVKKLKARAEKFLEELAE